MSNPTPIPNIQDLIDNHFANLQAQNATLQGEKSALQAQVASLQGEKSALLNENAKCRQENENLQQQLAAMTGDQVQNPAKSIAQQSSFMQGLEQQQGRGNMNNNDDHDDDYNNDDYNDNYNNNDYYEDEQNESINNNTHNANQVRPPWIALAKEYKFPEKFCPDDKKRFWVFLHDNGVNPKGRNWLKRAKKFADDNKKTITTYDEMFNWGKTAQQKAKENKNNNQDLDAENVPEQAGSSAQRRNRD